MELNQQDIDILDRYFRNELTQEELAQLQSRMKEKEFGDAANSYLQTLEVVKELGRNELRAVLTSVKLDVESTNGFEKYKSSKPGGSASGAFTVSIIVLISGVIAWLYFSGNLEMHKLQQFISDSEKLDTVYHYKINRDTVIINKSDTVKRKTIRRVITDTVYIRTPDSRKFSLEDSLTKKSSNHITDTFRINRSILQEGEIKKLDTMVFSSPKSSTTKRRSEINKDTIY